MNQHESARRVLEYLAGTPELFASVNDLRGAELLDQDVLELLLDAKLVIWDSNRLFTKPDQRRPGYWLTDAGRPFQGTERDTEAVALLKFLEAQPHNRAGAAVLTEHKLYAVPVLVYLVDAGLLRYGQVSTDPDAPDSRWMYTVTHAGRIAAGCELDQLRAARSVLSGLSDWLTTMIGDRVTPSPSPGIPFMGGFLPAPEPLFQYETAIQTLVQAVLPLADAAHLAGYIDPGPASFGPARSPADVVAEEITTMAAGLPDRLR